MVATPSVISLKIVSENDSATEFLMVQSEDIDEAKAVALRWAEQRKGMSSAHVEIHQGKMQAPDSSHWEVFEGFRVWDLPF